MDIVFNIIIIGLVVLIAYWWGNQGLFSAILHLLCVIAAGAIALAVWEPLVTGVLLHNTFFDNYAWGVGLITPFVLSLLVLRVIFDKTCGANVQLPRWANLTFGSAVGAVAGVITIGMFVISAGFIHSHREIMGFTGYARSREHRAQVNENQSMWLPVHTITANFYSMLSGGALYPDFNDTPLRQYYPKLDWEAVSLHRDSVAEGRGRTTLTPSDASVARVLACETCNPKRYAVEMHFGPGARDYGEQLTLTSAQIHLIGQGSDPKIAFPVEFTQYSGHHRFDDITHAITSEPAQQDASVLIEFNASDLGTQPPRFIMVRGTRYRLPKAESIDASAYATALQSTAATTGAKVEISPNGVDISNAITVTKDIRPLTISINRIPAGMQYTKKDDKNWLSGGDAEFQTVSPDRPGRGLEISGLLEPDKTRIVQVDVSRGANANIYAEKLMLTAGGENPLVQLVDTQGRPYVPVGYIWTQPNGKTRIKLDYEHYLKHLNDLPALPTTDTHKLRLVFVITDGATLAGLKLGDSVVGTCNILVQDPLKRQPQGSGGMVGGG